MDSNRKPLYDYSIRKQSPQPLLVVTAFEYSETGYFHDNFAELIKNNDGPCIGFFTNASVDHGNRSGESAVYFNWSEQRHILQRLKIENKVAKYINKQGKKIDDIDFFYIDIVKKDKRHLPRRHHWEEAWETSTQEEIVDAGTIGAFAIKPSIHTNKEEGVLCTTLKKHPSGEYFIIDDIDYHLLEDFFS